MWGLDRSVGTALVIKVIYVIVVVAYLQHAC
jgi:hypothetical protein